MKTRIISCNLGWANPNYVCHRFVKFHNTILDTCGNQLDHEKTQSIVFAKQYLVIILRDARNDLIVRA